MNKSLHFSLILVLSFLMTPSINNAHNGLVDYCSPNGSTSDKSDLNLNIPYNNVPSKLFTFRNFNPEVNMLFEETFGEVSLFNNTTTSVDIENRFKVVAASSSNPLKSNISVRTWPNPAQNVVNFESAQLNIDKVEVYSIIGIKVFEDTNASNQIDISNLPLGIYLLKCIDSKKDKVFTKKIKKL